MAARRATSAFRSSPLARPGWTRRLSLERERRPSWRSSRASPDLVLTSASRAAMLGELWARSVRRVRRLAAVSAFLLVAVVPAGGAEVVGRSIYADGLEAGTGQHASVVEPDTFAVGDTVVSVFQVGRRTNGGADAIGWATSRDGGRTWRSGLLPGVTPAGGGGDARFTHASDPAVAYDPVHGVWLAYVLALSPGRDEDD